MILEHSQCQYWRRKRKAMKMMMFLPGKNKRSEFPSTIVSLLLSGHVKCFWTVCWTETANKKQVSIASELNCISQGIRHRNSRIHINFLRNVIEQRKKRSYNRTAYSQAWQTNWYLKWAGMQQWMLLLKDSIGNLIQHLPTHGFQRGDTWTN